MFKVSQLCLIQVSQVGTCSGPRFRVPKVCHDFPERHGSTTNIVLRVVGLPPQVSVQLGFSDEALVFSSTEEDVKQVGGAHRPLCPHRVCVPAPPTKPPAPLPLFLPPGSLLLIQTLTLTPEHFLIWIVM